MVLINNIYMLQNMFLINGRDEINLILKNNDYGLPFVSYGKAYW